MKIDNTKNIYKIESNKSYKNENGEDKFEKILNKNQNELESKNHLNHAGRLRDEKLYNSLMSNYINNLISIQYSNKNLDSRNFDEKTV